MKSFKEFNQNLSEGSSSAKAIMKQGAEELKSTLKVNGYLDGDQLVFGDFGIKAVGPNKFYVTRLPDDEEKEDDDEYTLDDYQPVGEYNLINRKPLKVFTSVVDAYKHGKRFIRK
jgi:hypothetical protein